VENVEMEVDEGEDEEEEEEEGQCAQPKVGIAEEEYSAAVTSRGRTVRAPCRDVAPVNQGRTYRRKGWK
jgi:hypothetical protein